MRELFHFDGPLQNFGRLIADVIILSFMWLLFSLPIITIGAATSALYFTTTRRIADREGYITRDFWLSFKKVFKKSTILWLGILALSVGTFLNIRAVNLGYYTESSFALPVNIGLLILVAMMSVYIFPVAARFDMNIKTTLKTCFYMAFRHILTTASCMALMAFIVLTVSVMPLFIFFAMGLYVWLSSYLIMLVFQKYRPDMDIDPRIELAQIEEEKEKARREKIREEIGSKNDE
jgi:uncharacterized membrane protein YesL